MDVRDSDVVVVVVAVVVVVVVVTEVVAEEEQPQGTSVQWQSPLVLHQDPSRKASQNHGLRVGQVGQFGRVAVS